VTVLFIINKYKQVGAIISFVKFYMKNLFFVIVKIIFLRSFFKNMIESMGMSILSTAILSANQKSDEVNRMNKQTRRHYHGFYNKRADGLTW